MIYLTDYNRSITERLAKARRDNCGPPRTRHCCFAHACGPAPRPQAPPCPPLRCSPLQDPFSDPSQASLTCLANRPVTIPDEAAIAGAEGKEIFSERKGLNLFQVRWRWLAGACGSLRRPAAADAAGAAGGRRLRSCGGSWGFQRSAAR